MSAPDALRAWVEDWTRRGRGDLRLGELGLADADFDSFELIAFHAQQCAEKLIKAFLAKNGTDFEDQHDLEYLLGLVRRSDAALLADELDPVVALNRYAVRTRYPGRYPAVSPTEAEGAMRIASTTAAVILPRVSYVASPTVKSLRDRLREQREREQPD
ncbi:MAG TPA: HEPN domain-containing protein [Longimicrobium sp.]|jgi:HEPN domain-containing protein